MSPEQVSALEQLRDWCKGVLRDGTFRVADWQWYRKRVNKALVPVGRPRKLFPKYGGHSGVKLDLLRGVPVATVGRKYKVSRTTLYKLMKLDPELKKLVKEKPKPDPVPSADQTPLPPEVMGWLRPRCPRMVANPHYPASMLRVALGVQMVNAGLVGSEDEYDTLTDAELVERVRGGV